MIILLLCFFAQEIMKKKLEIQKQKQELLKKQIEQQKVCFFPPTIKWMYSFFMGTYCETYTTDKILITMELDPLFFVFE